MAGSDVSARQYKGTGYRYGYIHEMMHTLAHDQLSEEAGHGVQVGLVCGGASLRCASFFDGAFFGCFGCFGCGCVSCCLGMSPCWPGWLPGGPGRVG